MRYWIENRLTEYKSIAVNYYQVADRFMNFVPLIRCMARTTVSLRKATYDRLRKRGDASDSFDDVVNRLLERTADKQGEST